MNGLEITRYRKVQVYRCFKCKSVLRSSRAECRYCNTSYIPEKRMSVERKEVPLNSMNQTMAKTIGDLSKKNDSLNETIKKLENENHYLMIVNKVLNDGNIELRSTVKKLISFSDLGFWGHVKQAFVTLVK